MITIPKLSADARACPCSAAMPEEIAHRVLRTTARMYLALGGSRSLSLGDGSVRSVLGRLDRAFRKHLDRQIEFRIAELTRNIDRSSLQGADASEYISASTIMVYHSDGSVVPIIRFEPTGHIQVYLERFAQGPKHWGKALFHAAELLYASADAAITVLEVEAWIGDYLADRVSETQEEAEEAAEDAETAQARAKDAQEGYETAVANTNAFREYFGRFRTDAETILSDLKKSRRILTGEIRAWVDELIMFAGMRIASKKGSFPPLPDRDAEDEECDERLSWNWTFQFCWGEDDFSAEMDETANNGFGNYGPPWADFTVSSLADLDRAAIFAARNAWLVRLMVEFSALKLPVDEKLSEREAA